MIDIFLDTSLNYTEKQRVIDNESISTYLEDWQAICLLAGIINFPRARKIWLKYHDKIQLTESEILFAHKIANKLRLIHGLEMLKFLISCPPKPFNLTNSKELFSILDAAKDKKVNPVIRFLTPQSENPKSIRYSSYGSEVETFALFENINTLGNYYSSKRFKYSISFWVEMSNREVKSRDENRLVFKNNTSGEICGYLERNGNFTPARGAYIPRPIINLFFNVCDNPHKAIINYGQDTGNCSFCDRELTDPISLRRKYGKKCALKHSEPWR